ncbi:hypothetical protein TNCV_1566571 [Trichonephila clavipes]|nr:hypothetical protein TNCV_1566571 [Trichonephila clavipes]
MELNDMRHGVVPVSKNLVNDMLICSSDYEGLIENSQMVRNPAKLREPSKEERISSSTDSKSVCSQEVITNLRPETYTQSLLNVPNGDLVAVKINGSNVQTNGQGIKESKIEVAFTCVFKNRILRGQPRKECISEFIDSILVQCCRDLITGIVKLELKAGLEVFRVTLWTFKEAGSQHLRTYAKIQYAVFTWLHRLDTDFYDVSLNGLVGHGHGFLANAVESRVVMPLKIHHVEWLILIKYVMAQSPRTGVVSNLGESSENTIVVLVI